MRKAQGTVRRWYGRWQALGTVEQVRLVFATVAILAVAGQMPQLSGGGERVVSAPVAVGCAVTLIVTWVIGIRAKQFAPGVIVIETVAITGLGLGVSDPHYAFGPLYTMLFLRCMYGTNRAAFGRMVAYVIALGCIFTFSPITAGLPLFVPISTIIMTVTMRMLAVCVHRIAEAGALSANLARTAGELMSAGTRAALREACEAGAARIAPHGTIRMVFDGTDEPADSAPHAVRFHLGDAELVIISGRPLSTAQATALQTLAAQASTALSGLAMRAELSFRASHDELTGLANRASYVHSLTTALASGTPCAALFIDLDDFKTVNDTLGHSAGDALLAQVAERLRGCLRSTDMPARFGGDEFAILVQDHVDVQGAAHAVATRLLHLLDDPFDLAGTPFYLRCSIGIAVDHRAGNAGAQDAATGLLRDADIAMYVAKASGKNRFEIFTPDMAGMVEQDLDARQELAAALARDEFELHYQPIVALPSQEIHTVEALIRWRHPERGLLFPGQFLPQAERSRLLADLERWVIVAACHEAARWGDDAAPAVSVNICPRHLARTWLVPTVRQALAVSGLPGHRLILEITEEALIADPEIAEANLRACVEMGVQIAIDDFGAGHASVGSLRSLPISTVKMDRALVIEDDGQQVVTAVVELAHALGLRVVAEGVETDEQLRRVQHSGCDAVQGYLFARPGPASALRFNSRVPEAITAA